MEPGRLLGPAVRDAHVAPADDVRPEPHLPSVLAGGELERAQRRRPPPRLPDRLLSELRPWADLHAGGALRDDGRRPGDRPGHPARFLQPPAADATARKRA